jgi:hypothetical protein
MNLFLGFHFDKCYSQIFYCNPYFPSEKKFLLLFENFNISENNIISVEGTIVL